jgi:aspartate/methionine/tyrosine aminotransferase
MEWAKTRAHAEFNLAASGIAEFPLAELAASLQDLEWRGQSLYGHAPLQRRIAARYGVGPESVVATAGGCSLANHLALAALIDPGDEVLIEQPTYELLVSTAAFLGAHVKRFARRFEDDFRLDPREVAAALSPRTRVVVITSPHNPSSAVAHASALREVGALAASVRARVLVDEVYRDALFEAAPASACSLGPEFVVTSSLTKSYGLGGLRCGWVVAEPELARRIWRVNDLFSVSAAHPAETLGVLAFDHLDRIGARARGMLEANQRLFAEFLGRTGALQAPRVPPVLVAFPRLASRDVDAFCDELRLRHATSIVPGRFFDMPDHVRIGLGGPTAMVEGGLERLAAALAAREVR